MKTYFDIVSDNKQNIVVEAKRIIDDKTLQQSYNISTNLHLDRGICNEMFTSFHGTKKRDFNKQVQQYQKVIGGKFKLVATDNSLGYTRLVYRLTKNKQK